MSNQVKEGYKQTEIGLIPEDWEVKKLADILKIRHGKSQKEVVDPNGIYPILGTGGEMGKTNIPLYAEPSVLIGRKGTIDSPRYMDTPFWTVDTLFYSEIFKNTDAKFVFYKFNLIDWYSYNEASGVPSLNAATIENIKQAFPTLKEEQSAIAQALSDVDALIAALDKLIAKKRDLKTATMQQLLMGKKRLPGFDGEWVEKQIKTEIDLLTGYPFPSAKYSDSGIKLLRGSNIKRGETDWSEDLVQYWSEVTSDITQYILNESDIVIAMDGSLVGRSFAQLSKSDIPALLLQRVARIRSNKIDIGYLKEWICSKFFTEYCDSVKTVTAIPHISPDDIKNFKIKIPQTIKEQRAIALVLSDMDNAIALLESRLTKTQAIKQGMMQELLTGRTRLI